MAFILSSFLSFLLLYKYIGLFLVSCLAALLLPLPSSSILAAAGAFAAQGYFNIEAVLIVAFVGNVAGDNAGYLLTRLYGMRFIRYTGLNKKMETPTYRTLSLYMRDFSYSLIFFSRFLTTVGPLVNVLSSLTKIRYTLFLAVDIIGEIAYTLLYGLVGYFLGSEWQNNFRFLFEATFVVLTLGATLSLIQYGVFKRMKKGKIHH